MPMKIVRTRVDCGHHRSVWAEYSGGAYIELTFINVVPTEVINVWDDEKNCGGIPMTVEAVTAEVQAWAKTLEKEGFPDWFPVYVRNASA
jgi:hypothetical protein